MYQFKIHKADNLSTAVDLFNASDEPVYIAGGHTLIPTMKQRLSAPSDVIDLAKIPDLDAITLVGETLQIGAMATHAQVAASSLVQGHCPALATLAGVIKLVLVSTDGVTISLDRVWVVLETVVMF